MTQPSVRRYSINACNSQTIYYTVSNMPVKMQCNEFIASETVQKFDTTCIKESIHYTQYKHFLHWIEQGLTSPQTQYRLSGRQFYRSKDPTNSIKVLKEKLASHRPEEAPYPPGTSHHVTNEPLKKEKPYHSGSSPARQSPTQQAGLYKSS